MAGQGLDKITLKNDILTLFRDMRNIENNEEAEEKYASDLADIIEKYVKSGKVVTTGSAAAQTGMVT